MEITLMNITYCNTISIISNQLNEMFTKKGWAARFGKACGVIYYNYLNKLNENNICLDNYNQFDIFVGKNYAMKYIKSHPDLIIIDNTFSINLNNINIFVRIDETNICENDINCLNNINVIHHKKIFEYMQNNIKLKIFNQIPEQLEFNSSNIDKMIHIHQVNFYKLSCLKIFDNINKLMEGIQTQDKLLYASKYITRRNIPIVPRNTGNLSLLLDAANYIDNQNSIEPPAKRKCVM